MFDLQDKALQRAKGRAHVGFESGRLKALSQAGSAKVMLPATHDAVPEAVFLNTAGGLTGGDRFSFSGAVEGGTVMMTTQTAERAYASTGNDAVVDVSFRVGEGATLYWLPQETILFDQSALKRHTRIDAAQDARVLALEMIVLGRAAMGERLTRFSLLDRRELHGAAPIWVDALRLDETLLGAAAGLGTARAFATLLFYAPDAEDIARRLTLPGSLALSAWDGKLVIRGAAADLWPLKQALAPVIGQLTGGRLPRVWAV